MTCVRSFVRKCYTTAIVMSFFAFFVKADPVPANPLDTITFVNGDHITGRLSSANPMSIRFTGATVGDISVEWKNVSEITLGSGSMLITYTQQPSGVKIYAPDIVMDGAVLRLKNPAPGLSALPLSDLLSVTPEAAPEVTIARASAAAHRYFGTVGGALKISPDSIVRATQKQISLAGAFDIGLSTQSQEPFKHQDTNLGMEVNYSDSRKLTGAPVITELYSGTFQQNIYLRHSDPNHLYSINGPYLYGLVNEYHNLSLGMNFAQSYGGGFGWDGDHGGSSYTLAADLRMVKEALYAPGNSFSMAAAGITEQYGYTFGSTGINISERLTFVPGLTHSRAYQYRGTASLSIPINKILSLDFSLLDDYLENAPPKNLQNFSKYIFSLKYTIGARPKVP